MVTKTNAVCIREVQKSIKESVYRLLCNKIIEMGLQGLFQIMADEIRTPWGGVIIFRGMQDYNAENIKSLEDFDIAWVEEAQTLSRRSLRLLRPTIRKEGSELWFSWNPRFKTDAVDELFRGPKKLSRNVVSCLVNWRDNPWFPLILKEEREEDFERDEEEAEHVWEGAYEGASVARYFSKEVKAVHDSGRAGHYPHIRGLPVYTSWDIGVADYTSIWFWQHDGLRVYVIDFWETEGEGPQQIVPDCLPETLGDNAASLIRRLRIKRPRPFKYGRHFLPHDVKAREWGAGARQRVQQLAEMGVKPIHRGVAADPADRIAASRKLFRTVHFNTANPRVAIGLAHLEQYSRRYNKILDIYTGELHDEHSHAADAFGEFAINKGIWRDEVRAKGQPKPGPGQAALPGPPEDRVEEGMRKRIGAN